MSSTRGTPQRDQGGTWDQPHRTSHSGYMSDTSDIEPTSGNEKGQDSSSEIGIEVD